MTELEGKSAYYLRHYQRIGDEDEIKEKVKIMCDRFQDLYREHGLNALHDLFENVEDLELAIGSEDRWQRFMDGLVYPRPTEEFKYVRHILVSIATSFVIAVVLVTPFSYKYAKRFVKGDNYNIVDAEWKGAENAGIVIVRRKKKRSRRILLKPMLSRFDLKTELPKTSETSLEEAKEVLKLRLNRQQAYIAKKTKEYEEELRKSQLDTIRRSKLLDDDENGFNQWPANKDEQPRRNTNFLVDVKLRHFWRGYSRMRKRSK